MRCGEQRKRNQGIQEVLHYALLKEVLHYAHGQGWSILPAKICGYVLVIPRGSIYQIWSFVLLVMHLRTEWVWFPIYFHQVFNMT